MKGREKENVFVVKFSRVQGAKVAGDGHKSQDSDQRKHDSVYFLLKPQHNPKLLLLLFLFEIIEYDSKVVTYNKAWASGNRQDIDVRVLLNKEVSCDVPIWSVFY